MPGSSRNRGSLFECHFRFGRLTACVRTDDEEFSARFLRIFSDCVTPNSAGTEEGPVVLQVVASTSEHEVISELSLHEGRTDAAALAMLYPGLHPAPPRFDVAGNWELFGHGSNGRALVAIRGNRIVLDRSLPWQMLIAHYFLNHLMRLQPKLLFCHGATIGIERHGVVLIGAKGAGKSTLSLALAARGHRFLGDEVVTIDSESGAVLPFPRAVSIRPGPQSAFVSRYVDENPVDWEMLADGTRRARVSASRLFPSASEQAIPLTHAFFLEGTIARVPEATAIKFSFQHLPLVSPLHATLASGSAAQRSVEFLRLLNRVACYRLTPGGTPDHTAEFIERMVEEQWDTASRKEPNFSAHFAG